MRLTGRRGVWRRGVRGVVARGALAVLVAACVVNVPAAEGPRARQEPTVAAGEELKEAAAERTRYRIRLQIDFDARSYTGTQFVRWVNRDDRPTSVLYFHLYPNLRADADPAAAATRGGATAEETQAAAASDEPRLEVTRVAGGEGAAEGAASPVVSHVLEDGGLTMRVVLREAVAPGASVEVRMSFRGSVPEISADETSLPAHVVQQVGAALRDSREVRRARDTNFVSRGVMLLGSFHPVLAVRDDGGGWQRRVAPSVGDQFFAEAADYEVHAHVKQRVGLFASCANVAPVPSTGTGKDFRGKGLRHFAIIAGPSLRSAERRVGGVTVESVYTAEHEKIGRRALDVAAEAVRVFANRFGPLPYGLVTVAEAPLVAGLGSTEFSGLAVIASAFYVDFDSPVVRNLPELVREQRASVEDSLEFAVAQGVAHQWWGATVGNDPERAPVLDEALAHWSALVYVQDVHGEERARLAQDDQLRGVYQIYRTFGGEDRPAASPASEYRNSFQYAAIVVSKGALLLAALRQLLGEARFFKALRGYYEANRFEIAEMEDLRAAFVAEAELLQRRMVTRLFNRWLNERRGDEDIAPPNPQLASALGLPSEQQQQGARDRNAFSRLGRFFWRQMTRIR